MGPSGPMNVAAIPALHFSKHRYLNSAAESEGLSAKRAKPKARK
jgi:hypothetical protein